LFITDGDFPDLEFLEPSTSSVNNLTEISTENISQQHVQPTSKEMFSTPTDNSQKDVMSSVLATINDVASEKTTIDPSIFGKDIILFVSTGLLVVLIAANFY